MRKPEKWPEKDVPSEFREPRCGVSLTTASEFHQGTGTNGLAKRVPHCSLKMWFFKREGLYICSRYLSFYIRETWKMPAFTICPFLWYLAIYTVGCKSFRCMKKFKLLSVLWVANNVLISALIIGICVYFYKLYLAKGTNHPFLN